METNSKAKASFNSADFIDYEEYVASLDENKLLQELRDREAIITKAAKKPLIWGPSGVLAAGIFFLVTGIFTGFTTTALWFAGTITGALAAGTATAAIAARFRARKYHRVLKDIEKYKEMKKNVQDFSKSQFVELERKIAKGLNTLHKRRIISQAEVLFRKKDCGLAKIADSNLKPVTVEDIVEENSIKYAEATKLNQGINDITRNIDDIVSQQRKTFTDRHGIEDVRRFTGKAEQKEIIVAIPVRDEKLQIQKNEYGKPQMYTETLKASNEFDFALITNALVDELETRANEGRITLPISLVVRQTDTKNFIGQTVQINSIDDLEVFREENISYVKEVEKQVLNKDKENKNREKEASYKFGKLFGKGEDLDFGAETQTPEQEEITQERQ